MKVELFAWVLVARLLLYILQVVVANAVPDHKHSMDDVFMSDKRSPPHPFLIETLFGGFDNWDSEYYIHIAEYGYNYEICLAFFPLYPMLMRFIALLFPVGVVPFRSVALISGVGISNVAFLVSSYFLYRLTLKVFPNKRDMALVSVLLYAFNPASVFMSSVYTESAFACACLGGMLSLAHSRPYRASLAFAAAGALRSNGAVTAGFVAYAQLQSMASKVWPRWELSLKDALRCLIEMTAQCSIVVSPFVLFQYFSYRSFCFGSSELPSFCSQFLPLSYSYVQRKYWDVGFLRYYQLKQVPNFLLALPMVVLVTLALKKYFENLRTLALRKKNSICAWLVSRDVIALQFPYQVHLLFLLLFAVTSIHVQVLTRLICSSSPVIYWFGAKVLLQSLKPANKDSFVKLAMLREWRSGPCLLVWYFGLYIIVGFTLHCNFYPWT